MKLIFLTTALLSLLISTAFSGAASLAGVPGAPAAAAQNADYVPCSHRCGMFEPRADAPAPGASPEAYDTYGQRPVIRQWRYPGDYDFVSPPSYDEDASPLDNLLGGAASMVPR